MLSSKKIHHRMPLATINIVVVLSLITLFFRFRTVSIPEAKQSSLAPIVKGGDSYNTPDESSHANTFSSTPVIVKGGGSYNLENPDGVGLSTDGETDWSQTKQSPVIDNLFQRKRGGFFVELGGYDGEKFSNSLFFEKNRGWNGLLIEANPYTYRQMLEKDRNCSMVNACVSSDTPTMNFIIAGAITSAVETMSPSHKARIKKDNKTYGNDTAWEGHGKNVSVNCASLSSLMMQVGQKHVDFFSLDVEGAELFILESIDFDDLHFDIVMIEVQEHRDEINKFMESKGFVLARRLQWDDIYRYL